MAEKKKQHYIPQFYLKKFVQKTDNPKIEPSLWVHKNGVSKKKSPSNTGFESYFYAIDGEDLDKNHVEDLLSTIESDTKPVLDRMLSLGIHSITEHERYIFARFLSFMFSRTPKMRELNNIALSRVIKDYAFQKMNRDGIPLRFKNLSKDSVIELLNEHWTLPKDALIGMGLYGSVNNLPEFNDRNWCLFHTNDSHFITSDHPVVLINKYVDNDKALPGIVMRNTDFMFPLSPRVCLYGSYDNVVNQSVSSAKVKEINSLIFKQSTGCIFSYDQCPEI